MTARTAFRFIRAALHRARGDSPELNFCCAVPASYARLLDVRLFDQSEIAPVFHLHADEIGTGAFAWSNKRTVAGRQI
jgi:hypothetical protein